ncbi:MAG: methyltransferase domain-containing protein [Actinomycetales bacterium]
MESPAVLAAGIDRLLAGSHLPSTHGPQETPGAESGPDAARADAGNEFGVRQVLDLGGGTGGQAVRLAKLGHHVTVVDPSADALAILARRVRDEGLEQVLRGVQGDAEDLASVIADDSIDLVLCHGVLEVVDDPRAALRSVHRVLHSGGMLSLVVSQRDAAVLSRVVAGQIRAARQLLQDPDGRWGPGDPLQRRFTGPGLDDLLAETGFEVLGSEGIRPFSDLVPYAAIADDPSAMVDLATLEEIAATVPALRAVAGHLHVHASPR